MSGIVLSFQKLIDVNTPIIYIHDYDFARVDEIIADSIGNKRIVEWNPVTGTTDFKTKEGKGFGEMQSLEDFLCDKYSEETAKENYIVLKEVHELLDEQKVKTVLALMSQRKLYDRDYETTIIVVSSVIWVPVEIKKYVSFLEVEFPTDEAIGKLIDEHIEVNFYDHGKFTEDDRRQLMPSLKGMTAFEIDRILDVAMSSNGSLGADDKEMILRQKKQMVKKSGLLELVDTPKTIDNIGGLDALKDYMKAKSSIIRNYAKARDFGVSVPKGIFIVGMPGCGKSLCAKASASLFDAPLLKLDMGNMMGKYVGESEANLREAIKIAEAAAPCVLWIDEIEKGFSGIGGHNDIMTRMFGYFLSWMQDKESPVYVMATANNANNLPPELLRKGRFDEIFCVNLPNQKERKAIFEVHIKAKKALESVKDSDITLLAKITDGFNGADIESVVNESVEDCFRAFQEDKQYNALEILKERVGSTVSISKSCQKQIGEMKRNFAENSFKDATSGKITSSKSE